MKRKYPSKTIRAASWFLIMKKNSQPHIQGLYKLCGNVAMPIWFETIENIDSMVRVLRNAMGGGIVSTTNSSSQNGRRKDEIARFYSSEVIDIPKSMDKEFLFLRSPIVIVSDSEQAKDIYLQWYFTCRNQKSKAMLFSAKPSFQTGLSTAWSNRCPLLSLPTLE